VPTFFILYQNEKIVWPQSYTEDWRIAEHLYLKFCAFRALHAV